MEAFTAITIVLIEVISESNFNALPIKKPVDLSSTRK